VTYRDEFPTFPEADLPPIPASWSDLSWHNDASPFFLITDAMGVWVDFADPALSDLGENREARFALVPMRDGQHVEEGCLLYSDDWNAILAKAIGLEFVGGLRLAMSEEEFELMRERNVKRPQGVCHSHDFLDSNMTMAEAFERVMGREPDVGDEADASLWSAAWEGAMPDLTKRVDMRDRIREQTGLAQTFADDGAYHSAARVLGDLATEIKAHADRVTAELNEHLTGAN